MQIALVLTQQLQHLPQQLQLVWFSAMGLRLCACAASLTHKLEHLFDASRELVSSCIQLAKKNTAAHYI